MTTMMTAEAQPVSVPALAEELSSPSTTPPTRPTSSGGRGFAALLGRFEKAAIDAQSKQLSFEAPRRSWLSQKHKAESNQRAEDCNNKADTDVSLKAEEEKESAAESQYETADSELEQKASSSSSSTIPEAPQSPMTEGAATANVPLLEEGQSSATTSDKPEEVPQNELLEPAVTAASSVNSSDGNSKRMTNDDTDTAKNNTNINNSNNNHDVLLEIATTTNSSVGNSTSRPQIYVATDDEESSNDSDDDHRGEEEAAKEALLSSSTNRLLMGIAMGILNDEQEGDDPGEDDCPKEATQQNDDDADGDDDDNDDTNQTHDAELNAFYASVKQKKEPFVPPKHITPRRQPSKTKKTIEQVVEDDVSPKHTMPRRHHSDKNKKRDAVGQKLQQAKEQVHTLGEPDSTITCNDNTTDHTSLQEPKGHRIEEDYTRPPPNFVVAEPSRRRQQQQKIRNNHSNKQSGASCDPAEQKEHQQLVDPSPATSLTSSEPRGKRLPEVYVHNLVAAEPSKAAETRTRHNKVINQERLQSRQDCVGVAPKNQMYPTRRIPVDVPGSKLPDKFPGQSATEEKIAALRQQVAMAENIIKLRAMKKESERLKASLQVQQQNQTWPPIPQVISTSTCTPREANLTQEHIVSELALQTSSQNNTVLLAKLATHPTSKNVQNRTALPAKLAAQPIDKRKEANAQHKNLLVKFEQDMRVTQIMHDQMVILVKASFEAKTAAMPMSMESQENPSQRQLLQQLEYDSLRQQLEYEKLMQQLGKMLPTQTAPSWTLPGDSKKESCPFDEILVATTITTKGQPVEIFKLGKNTALQQREVRAKCPTKKPMDAPPMRVTISKAPPPTHGFRTIDDIPLAGRKHSSRGRAVQQDSTPFDESPDVAQPQYYPPPQQVQQCEEKNIGGGGISMEVDIGGSYSEVNTGRKRSLGQQQWEQDRWRQILSSSNSLV